jgi:hypothetical protein
VQVAVQQEQVRAAAAAAQAESAALLAKAHADAKLAAAVPEAQPVAADPFADELRTMKASALVKRARALGATAEQLDEVDDADDAKAAAVSLLLSIRDGLMGMKLSALKKQLRSMGASDDQVDELVDADDPKAAAVQLVLQMQSGGPMISSAAQPEPEPATDTVESHGQAVEVAQPSDEFDFVFSNRTASDALCLQIRATLSAQGIRVWQQKTNIPKDSDNWFNEWFPSAVKARKIVCFLTVAYLKSPYCMKEFGIALASHKLLVVACEPLAQINAVDPSAYPYASNALAYLMGGGQVIFHDSEDVVAEILKFVQ